LLKNLKIPIRDVSKWGIWSKWGICPFWEVLNIKLKFSKYKFCKKTKDKIKGNNNKRSFIKTRR